MSPVTKNTLFNFGRKPRPEGRHFRNGSRMPFNYWPVAKRGIYGQGNYLETMAEGKFFYIKSELSDLVMTVEDGRYEPSTPIVLQPTSDVFFDRQLFYKDHQTYTIRSKLNDFCLHMHQQTNTLMTYPYQPMDPDQQWTISGPKIFNRDDRSRILEVMDSSTDPGVGICCNEATTETNQKWEIDYAPPQFFYLTSKLNGKVLDVKKGSKKPGTGLIMYKKHVRKEDNQIWYEDRNGFIHSMLNDFVLDSGNDDKFRLEPQMPGSSSQDWIFVTDRIVNRQMPSKVAEIKNGKKGDNVDIVAGDATGEDYQMWEMEYI